MNLMSRAAAGVLLTIFLTAPVSIQSSTFPTNEFSRNSNVGNNSSSTKDSTSTIGIDYISISNTANDDIVSKTLYPQQRLNSRHLLGRNTECVLYLKTIQYEDGSGEDSWSCELPPDVSERFDGVDMIDIKGVSKAALDGHGAVSGESIVRVDASAYIERSFEGNKEYVALQIPPSSNYDIEMMDSKVDLRHAKNRRERIRRRRRLETGIEGSLDTLKVLVVRVIDGGGRGPDANVEELQEHIFTGKICLKSQYEACSHGQVSINQATEVSTILENNVTVPGIIDVQIKALAEEDNHLALELEAVAEANKAFGEKTKLSETVDLVMFCQPGGTGDWLAYAYVNDWRSFYNNEWCQRVSAQMHEVGHNLNLAHSGLPNDSVYADKSGMMGFSYTSENGPIQCFNAAKSYQLGWYKEQTLSINPLDYIGDPQIFILNGIADYRKGGGNGNALVSLRLEHEGADGGIDYYIGYNRKKGCNIGTAQVPNLVTLIEKENPYAISKDSEIGPDGFGLSRRLAALKAGEARILENYAGTTSHVTIKVNFIAGKRASITIAASAPEPTQAPTICGRNKLKIEVGTDAFGAENRWSIREKESNEIMMRSSEGYFSNTIYELPGPDSSYCVTPGKCYIFTMTDKAGDGMCCAYGLGYYRGYMDGIQIFQGGKFKHKDSIEFCVPLGDDEEEFFVRTVRPSVLPTESPTRISSRRTLSPTTTPVPTEVKISQNGPVTTVSPSSVPTEDSELSSSPSSFPSFPPSKLVVQQTRAPSPDFTHGCGDSKEFRHKGKKKWSCEWLSTKGRGRKRKICNKTYRTGKVSHQCTKACADVGLGPCKKKRRRRGNKKPLDSSIQHEE